MARVVLQREKSDFILSGNSVLKVTSGSSGHLVCPVKFQSISVLGLLVLSTFQSETGDGWIGIGEYEMNRDTSYLHSYHLHHSTLHFQNQQHNRVKMV